MTPERTRAYLLRATPYGESDLIVALLTRNHGSSSYLARGARKSRRRFGGALDYFNLLEVEIKPRRNGLGTLHQAHLVGSFPAVRERMEAFWVGSYVLEVARLGSSEGAADHGLFDLVTQLLESLQTGGDPAALARVFQVRALAVFGCLPALDRCGVCGLELGSSGAAVVDQALTCARCSPRATGRLSPGTLGTLAAAARLPAGGLGRLRISAPIDSEIGPFLEASLRTFLGAEPRSQATLPVASKIDRI